MESRQLMESVAERTVWFAGYLSELYRASRVARRLDIPEDVHAYVDVNHPNLGKPSRITLFAGGDKMREAARALLPVVGTFAKKFDAASGEMALLGIVDGVEVEIAGKPPSTCEIKKVVKQVEFEATEAHVENVTTYEMVGDCDPLLKPPEPETVSEQTQSPTEEDVQHA